MDCHNFAAPKYRSSKIRASHSSLRGPWIPAPAKTSDGQKYPCLCFVCRKGSRWGCCSLAHHGVSDDSMLLTKYKQKPRCTSRTGKRKKGSKIIVPVVTVDPEKDDLERSPASQEQRVSSEAGDSDGTQLKSEDIKERVSSLIAEAGSLSVTSLLDLPRSKNSLSRQQNLLDSSKKFLDETQFVLKDTRDELDLIEQENSLLRQSVELLQEEKTFHQIEQSNHDFQLSRNLQEADMHANEASRQVEALRNSIRKLQKKERFSSHDCALLEKQKCKLLEKLSDFEQANQKVQSLLRQQQAANFDPVTAKTTPGMFNLGVHMPQPMKTSSVQSQSTTSPKTVPVTSQGATPPQATGIHNQESPSVVTSEQQNSRGAGGRCDVIPAGEYPQRKADEQEKNLQTLVAHLKQREAEVHQLEDELTQCHEEMSAMKREVRHHENEHRVLQERIRELPLQDPGDKVRVKELNQELQNKSKAISDLKHKNDRLEAALEGETGKLQAAQVKVKTLQERLERAEAAGDNTNHGVDEDHEALKEATSLLTEKCEKYEVELQKLATTLNEKEQLLQEQKIETDRLHSQVSRLQTSRAQLDSDNKQLQKKLQTSETQVHSPSVLDNSQISNFNTELQKKIDEISGLKLENERLRAALKNEEEKLRAEHKRSPRNGEVTELRLRLREQEGELLVYKEQKQKFWEAQEELEDVRRLLKLSQEETRNYQNKYMMAQQMFEEQHQHLGQLDQDHGSLQDPSGVNLDRVRTHIEDRLYDLEPLPELLKTTELRLQEVQKCRLAAEHRKQELEQELLQMKAQVERLQGQVEHQQNKWMLGQEEKRIMQGKIEALEWRQQEMDHFQLELKNELGKKDEILKQSSVQLEEKIKDNASLTLQLETAVEELRKEESRAKERLSARDRSLQARISDLENQLAHTRAEAHNLRRDKEEMQRKFQSQAADLRGRLEQAQVTNRSLQSYITFLKDSYASVFGAGTTTASTRQATMFS